MAADLQVLVDDLMTESADLDEILGRLAPPQWSLATPAVGWSIADQVSHLAYFDEATRQSLVDPDQFRRDADRLVAGGEDFADRIVAAYRGRPGAELLDWFRTARRALIDGYRAVDPRRRLPWYGPDMSPASSVTARLMETWAHGQDIVDTLGIERAATGRLHHIAHLSFGARPYSYAVHHLPRPTEPIRVELDAPAGDQWTWGPADAVNRVTGEALDFCLVLTQRRHPHDTSLVVTGPAAQQWIAIGQAFAGPAGPGRAPRLAGPQPDEPIASASSAEAARP
ncbi:MAG: TIGR03084 family metal-binding protein [Acidimicrobiales bacterium]